MIICAAIKRDWQIVRWQRHSDAIKVAIDLWRKKPIHYREHWFLNSDNVFLDREKAYKEALKCGQIEKKDHFNKELYSEDIY